jgi:hypothetical protein
MEPPKPTYKGSPLRAAVPVLQIKGSDRCDEFSVVASWPDGVFQEIRTFKNEFEANEWIVHQFQGWLEEQERDQESHRGTER